MTTTREGLDDHAKANRLALYGGTPVRTDPFPTVADPSGRTLGAEEAEAVARVLRSGMLCSVWGGEARALEREFAALYDVPHAIACSSGTAALHLAVGAVDPDPGDEIITSPLTDFGTIIPILRQNAVPVFADVDPATGILDPASVERQISERTRAILLVHLFGAPAPMAEFKELARDHGLVLIEDCAQALLAEPEPGRYAGTYGDIGCFSLQQTKHITTGDGGLVITRDDRLARRMRLFADKGWPRDTGERTNLFLAANYRMTELQAAVGRAQLTKLPDVVARRRRTAEALTTQIDSVAGLNPPVVAGSVHWQYPIVIDPRAAGGSNATWVEALAAEGIPASAGYLHRPLYFTPVLAEGRTYGRSRFPLTSPPARKEWTYGQGLCPDAERLIDQTLVVIGWNENYTAADVDDIATAIRKVRAGLTQP
jgi:dTDP-4-amino-4,6-dideoxygalactose transaminase